MAAPRRPSFKYSDPQQQKVFEVSPEYGEVERKKILLLEDDPDFMIVLRELLATNSYQVIAARDGVEGLKQIMAEDFDVIICDLLMPNLPGDMFYVAVERTRPHLCKRFIFMTGHKGDPKFDAFIRRVGAVMVWKPFQLQDLLDAIKVVLQKTQRSGAG